MISNVILSVETTLILSVAALYIIHCPFNKVEESFNTQAVHDIINIFPLDLPSNVSNDTNSMDSSHREIAIRSHLPWDHTQFQGVVPRTFIGAFFVGLPMKLAQHLMNSDFLTIDPKENNEKEADLTSQFILQIGSRFALTSYIALSLSAITRALHKRYGLSFRLGFLIITISQFHYMFYAGRFLPNTFAAVLSNLAFASWVNRQYSKSIIYMSICAVIFRFDTALFFGLLLLDAVFVRRFLLFSKVLKIGVVASLVSILITFTVDSIMWGRPVWPELESFYFNVVLNKSHDWGTQPFTWYIYSCIPRMMMLSGPLVLFADHKITREYLIPALAFVLVFSVLPHKELRFILFVSPLLNICATSGLMNIYYYLNQSLLYITTRASTKSPNSQSKSTKRRKVEGGEPKRSYLAVFMFSLIVAGMFAANMIGCMILSRVSSHNYPGGHAAIALGTTKELLDAAQKTLDASVTTDALQDFRSDVGVYVDNLAAQTGVSRFLQVNGAYYSKNPRLDSSSFRKSYSLIYLILEPQEITDLLRTYCPISENQEGLSNLGIDQWKKNDNEIKCTLSDQPRMFCSIIDTINSFKSINFGILVKRIKSINSLQSVLELFDEIGFIKTRTALHTIRCSSKSKFNPF